MMDDTLIVGLGEVGSALCQVLDGVHTISVKDTALVGARYLGPVVGTECDVMHVCFPYSETFEADVKDLQRTYPPGVTVVHSTVPVGTCRRLGAVHSPVIGLHPGLAQSLLTFTKFVGGPQAGKVAQHLGRAGIRCYVVDNPETTELLKLLSTTFYGLCIEWTKYVKEQCDNYGVPFEAHTLWTQAYNRGYQTMGRPEFTRPELVPILGRIGGHCVLPNLGLLGLNEFTDLIKRRNAAE